MAAKPGIKVIIVMGVSGSGKTTISQALAARTGFIERDGDDYHPAANIEKMKAGIPLTDADRLPWLHANREAFEAAAGKHLGDRLIAAMRAALAAGGEEGPVHSMGLVMVDKVSWNVADLRIDWTDGDPIEECAALWERWRGEMDAYVTRALDPSGAPSYGVPGDL